MNSIHIIQNTHYHFETVISLYSVLKQLNYNVSLYQCNKVKSQNSFNQNKFIEKYNISLSSSTHSIQKDDIGFVVSSYPSSLTKEIIPNNDDLIFSKIRKLIYICHRFGDESDYSETNIINRKNAICLSPLSKAIGVDYIYLIDSPINPQKNTLDNTIKLTIQGHFQLKNRTSEVLTMLDSLGYQKTILNIIGTKSAAWLGNNRKENVHVYEDINECEFYDLCNSTHFLIPSINSHIKNQTYIKERYSSNFNLAYILEKPIFAHEVFEKVYNIPGIYYNDNNILDQLYKLLDINNNQYLNLINNFTKIKKDMRSHNSSIILNKIQNV